MPTFWHFELFTEDVPLFSLVTRKDAFLLIMYTIDSHAVRSLVILLRMCYSIKPGAL